MPLLALIYIVMSYASFPDFSQITFAFPNFSLSGIFLIKIPKFFRFLKPHRNPDLNTENCI